MNQINDQKLLDYLNGKLSAPEQHEVEEWMLENSFNADALEGLQQSGASENVRSNIDQLNQQLRGYLQQNKKKRRSRIAFDNSWTYIAVLFVIILAVIVYLVVRMQIKN